MAANSCGTRLDHAVMIAGISTQHNAWIVRNSWGEGWGVTPTDPNTKGSKDQYSNCPDLVKSYGCSATLSGGVTTGGVCLKSCPPAGGAVAAGYIWLQYGGNTCGLTQSAYDVGPVAMVNGASSSAASSASSSSGGSSSSSSGTSAPTPAPGGCADTLPICDQVKQYCQYVSETEIVRIPGQGSLNDGCKKTCGLC